jgi:hypothetical protein
MVYFDLSVKLDLVKLLILFFIFSLAVWNILALKKPFKNATKYIFLFAILFGFFNGIGISSDFLPQLENNESEIIPLLEVIFAVGTSVLIIFLILLSFVTLVKKIPKIDKKKNTLFLSVVVIGILVIQLIHQIFN